MNRSLLLTAIALSCCRPPTDDVTRETPATSTAQEWYRPARVALEESEAPADWKAIAGTIPYLKSEWILRNLPPHHPGSFLSEAEHLAVLNIWQLAERTPRESLLQLIDDPNPRIRTVAMCALYLQFNPHDLPEFMRHAEDRVETFPSLVHRWGEPVEFVDKRYAGLTDPATRRQACGFESRTVADFAREMVNTYLEVAGYPYGLDGHGDGNQIFADYWQLRKERAHCLSWFTLRLQLATQRPPLSERPLATVASVREEIDALEPTNRAWTLLALAAPNGTANPEPKFPPLATIGELLDAAGTLPRRDLLRYVFGNVINADDPDFQIRQKSPWKHGNIRSFLLDHAASIFEREDAELFLNASQALRDASLADQPAWAIAAAQLQVERGEVILREAFKRFSMGKHRNSQDSRASIVQAMCRQFGPAADAFVRDWFFRENPDPNRSGSGRHTFARWLGKTDQRRLLRALISDPRAADLDLASVRNLGLAAADAKGESVMSNKDFLELNKVFAFHLTLPKGYTELPHPSSKQQREAVSAAWSAQFEASLR